MALPPIIRSPEYAVTKSIPGWMQDPRRLQPVIENQRVIFSNPQPAHEPPGPVPAFHASYPQRSTGLALLQLVCAFLAPAPWRARDCSVVHPGSTRSLPSPEFSDGFRGVPSTPRFLRPQASLGAHCQPAQGELVPAHLDTAVTNRLRNTDAFRGCADAQMSMPFS